MSVYQLVRNVFLLLKSSKLRLKELSGVVDETR